MEVALSKRDGEMGRWGDGEMGRWGDGEMGGWGDGEDEQGCLIHKIKFDRAIKLSGIAFQPLYSIKIRLLINNY